MAGSKGGGVTIEMQKQSFDNAKLQMEKLGKLAPELMYKALVTLLFDIKGLAQMKLKSDKHIDTSRLRNSLFVKSFNQKYAKRPNNSETYAAEGKVYKSDLDVNLGDKEAAVGTNVEYAAAIEFGYPPHRITAKNGKTLAYRLKPGETFNKGLFASINWVSDLKNKKIKKAETWVILGKSVQHPGFAGDSFLYWALKNVDADKRWRETSKELLNGLKI